MLLFLISLYFKGEVVKVDDLVRELSWPFLQLNSIPKLKVAVKYAKHLQLKYPTYQARKPGEQLSLSCISKILNVVLNSFINKIVFPHPLFNNQFKAFVAYHILYVVLLAFLSGWERVVIPVFQMTILMASA